MESINRIEVDTGILLLAMADIPMDNLAVDNLQGTLMDNLLDNLKDSLMDNLIEVDSLLVVDTVRIVVGIIDFVVS